MTDTKLQKTRNNKLDKEIFSKFWQSRGAIRTYELLVEKLVAMQNEDRNNSFVLNPTSKERNG